MEIITNQTLYKCSYCNKRLLTKSGCELHEKSYCKAENSPNRENCKHEIMETVYRGSGPYKEPDYDVCIHCGFEE